MKQKPCEASSRSTSHGIPRLLRNTKIYYCVYKISPVVPILKQMNPAHILTYYLFKVHFSIIFPPMPRFRLLRFFK